MTEILVTEVVTELVTEVLVTEVGTEGVTEVVTEVTQEWSEKLAENLPSVSIENSTTANVTSDTVTGTACLDFAMLKLTAQVETFPVLAHLLQVISYMLYAEYCPAKSFLVG